MLEIEQLSGRVAGVCDGSRMLNATNFSRRFTFLTYSVSKACGIYNADKQEFVFR
jgi:hypothetical protein